MKISAANLYDDAATTFTVVADANSGQDPDDMLTGDFSTAYTSLGTAATFSLTRIWSTNKNFENIAIAGHNFGDHGGTLNVKVAGASVGTVDFLAGSENHVVMFTFDVVNSNLVEIIFTKLVSTDKITITYISGGRVLPLGSQNNEQSGYPRVWRTRNKEIRTTVNAAAAPVAYLRQSMTRKVTLNINNVALSVVDNIIWFDQVLDRAYLFGDFFIKDDDGDTVGIADNPKSSYLCFNIEVAPPKAHNATRQLVNLQLKFNAYTGL